MTSPLTRLAHLVEDLNGEYDVGERAQIALCGLAPELLAAIQAGNAAKRRFDTMPWCRDDEDGEYTCVPTTVWKEWNYGEMHDLNEAILALESAIDRELGGGGEVNLRPASLDLDAHGKLKKERDEAREELEAHKKRMQTLGNEKDYSDLARNLENACGDIGETASMAIADLMDRVKFHRERRTWFDTLSLLAWEREKKELATTRAEAARYREALVRITRLDDGDYPTLHLGDVARAALAQPKAGEGQPFVPHDELDWPIGSGGEKTVTITRAEAKEALRRFCGWHAGETSASDEFFSALGFPEEKGGG